MAREEGLEVAGVTIRAWPTLEAPDGVEAVAREEDTFLVLSADPEPRPPVEHPLRILTAAMEQEPSPPGSVVVREGRPLRLLAVVHDLSRDPTWDEAWILAALRALLEETGRRGLRSLATEPLGSRHGRLPIERFLALLGTALREAPPGALREVLVLAPARRSGELARLLAP
jgi:hypothetical protein